ncbi:MAG: DUF11 domain-containing protein [Chloroflexi bacterium]|nr:DUF11 domain-containing protein [Chloroflexota bacterium]
MRTKVYGSTIDLKPILLRIVVAVLLFGTVFAQEKVPGVQAAGEQLILTKTVEGNVTEAQVGDMLRYRIRFSCSSLTTPCGPMEITDVLQPGLIYMPPPASSVPAGFSIGYASATRTITITKDDNNLLDGSQYDAVIAVTVDYDLRPLPAAINNTVNGRINPSGTWIPATPASAPPVTIDAANPHWGLTKTLSSPIINPTVDTDVTYQIRLCPTTPPPGEGNVPLRNITITDTMPVGATFVSASNGGTELSGTVTWPVVAGPIYPPNCLTRLVTIRYNSPIFSIGDSVTNTASADGVYTDSTGGTVGPVGVATNPIIHDIDPISEIPTYSKNDVGDPVGFSGTGRFVLNLNTNGTNYPSNELILIDNLPPELQVTGVTTGQWSSAFNHVRAYVEYSTNNGSSYTAFPGQPISYNTNAAYAAPSTKITNVRWRFEYDPDGLAPFTYTQAGLPYTWSFTTGPEVRITPRAVATTADLPSGAPLPAAVPGSTYNNCLQVSRRDSSGTSITDACDIEPMTVQGSFVSLRTSKNETPGASWDDLDDPLINTFTADGTILPGDTLRYRITVEVTERSSAPLIDPTILDTLPSTTDFIFVRNGTAQLDGVDLATQPVFSQPAADKLQWDFPGLTINPLPLGSHFLTVEFFARIPRGQAPGTYTNNLYTVTDSVDALCENGTQVEDSVNGDVDGDNDLTDPACQFPDTYVVERSAALRGEKWIRSTDTDNILVVESNTFLPSGSCPNGGSTGLAGGGSNPFTRFPCISQAFPEGALSLGQVAPPPASTTLDDFEYNLRIFNDGNVPMLEYVLYDILPFVGDTGSGGTLSSSARLSEFRPTLRGPVDFISGPAGLSSSDFTIEYNLTSNPCRPEVFDQPIATPNVPSACDDTWTTIWSTAARSYRIRLNSGSLIQPSSISSEVRFGVPMYIPLDALPAGFDPNDALSHEIAWNSFSHVGSYDKDPSAAVVIQDLLASEPRKVGITVPEVMSVGNRVWRDSDNSGTINPPDDSTPGIANVVVNLYQDFNNDGLPDGTPIGTTLTDSGGYYLFSNIPFDSAVLNNNRYVIGVPSSNFGAGQPLVSLRSSTGTPATSTYTSPPSTNGDNNDNGIDPITPGLEVFSASFLLQPGTEPVSETDLSANDRDGLAGQRRGVNGERDNNSDLTLDFGFFGGTDIPFSLGNHLWYDNGQTAPGIFNYAERNDGIRQSTEPPVAGVTVRLYRDGNYNGAPETNEMIRTDVTDSNGFYLFDNLDPGNYYVEIPATEFGPGMPLAGWYSSQPTGTETTGVNGGTTTADIDNDDNGINTNFPETNGVFSGVVVLTRGVPEPIGETYLSGEADPGAPGNQGYSPTGWDGSGSIGRFGESDDTSNITIDFGFIPPMSLGNRVWIDEGAGTTPFRAGYNNGLQDGTEAGMANVRVELWRDTNGTPGLQVTGTPDTFLRFTSTDAAGYYLFDRLQPGTDYFVHIAASNFAAGQPLRGYLSSTDTNQASPPADDAQDADDDGLDSATPATTGITSPLIVMTYSTEPLTPGNEVDIPANTPANVAAYGVNLRGLSNPGDGDSNLTMDFGFIRPPRSLGNRLWIDANNNGLVDGAEGPVPAGVRVSLYLDTNADNQPDDLGVTGDRTDDWIAYDLTDSNGYYLFDGLPAGIYIVGVDRSNFAAGGLLEGYNSSTGNVDNASNNTDDRDNGIDRLLRADPVASPHGILSTRVNLTATPVGAPTTEIGSGDTSTASGFNPTAGDGANSRGRYGEANNNSDLTIDFGFFVPMSLGNRVFVDDGTGGGIYNNGIMDGSEVPVPGVRVELYHDVDANGVPDIGGLLGFDVTDAGGYYLFDDLAEGSYVVLIVPGNFTASFDPDGGGPLPTAVGALLGYNTSVPTGTETAGVAGNSHVPNTDADDNGVNAGTPATTGVLSGTIALLHDTEPTVETELSGQVDPGSPANLAFSPTGWDGPVPGSRGRWDEIDANSNLTIDFGFIPIFSLGNRVWFDTDNNGSINGAEVGINGIVVNLYSASDLGTILATQTTAGGGYYLFNDLEAGDYIISIDASNFSGVLAGYWSSGTTRSLAGTVSELTAALSNNDIDSDDNGTLQTGAPLSGAVISSVITLGPDAVSEPSGETDLDVSLPGNHQGQPDTHANMTVDFGFYTIQLGNLIWDDTNNNGLLDGGESGINAVDVQLWTGDGTLQLASTTTAGGGLYAFNNLPEGSYLIRIPASEFNPGGTLRDYVSSTGSLVTPPSTYQYEAAPNAESTTTDSDDNGTAVGSSLGPDGTYNSSLGLGGYVQSSVFTLTPGGEATVTNSTGLTSEPRIDFGLYTNVQTDLTITKDDGVSFYIPGEVLNYTIVVSNNGPSDVTGAQVADVIPPQFASWVWACDAGNPVGSDCDGTSSSADFQDTINLLQGERVTYDVTATVSTTPSGVLDNTATISAPPGTLELNPADNTDTDSDDFASLQISKDDGLDIVSAGNTITYQIVVTNNGLIDLTAINVTDTLPADLTFVSASPVPTTQVGNALAWTGLSLTAGSSTTLAVTATIGASPSATITNTANAVDTNTNASDSDDDVDYTASTPQSSITKTLIATDAIHTADPDVTIGEILTYEVVLSMPVGSMTNAIVVDTPQTGLAFVDLTSLMVSNVDTDGAALTDTGIYSSLMTFDTGTRECSNCVAGSTPGTSNPLVENNGQKVTFDFDTLTNTSATTETITIQYTVVILDIASNQHSLGTTLTNDVTWTWDGGNSVRPATVPAVTVVEPELTIDKNAVPMIAPLGATITFTIDLSHSSLSSADAFDVVVTDVLPSGLEYVPGTFTFTRTAGTLLQPPTFNYNSATATLTFVWDEFQLAQGAHLEFQATFIGPSPVQNTATAEWTSLEIDPSTTQRSAYNPNSTERWYDPLSTGGLDDYGVTDSISVHVPRKLPKTGFAPGIVTRLPAMPADLAYSQTDLVLEIPRLGVQLTIVGVPFGKENWDLTWLGENAGWLEGSAFPTHAGNSALTAHAYLADGTAGPFAQLNSLRYGDQIIVHLGGQKYIYEVRENLRVGSNGVSVLKHEELPWLTLITCQTYSEGLGDYIYRIAIRAVLIKVE